MGKYFAEELLSMIGTVHNVDPLLMKVTKQNCALVRSKNLFTLLLLDYMYIVHIHCIDILILDESTYHIFVLLGAYRL